MINPHSISTPTGEDDWGCARHDSECTEYTKK